MDALGLQFADELGHIGSGAARRGVRRSVGTAIEGRKVNDAQTQNAAVLLWQIHNARLGLLILQFNLVADEGDRLARGIIGGARGNKRQADARTLRAANQLHRIRERHVHDVHGFPIPLSDGDNAVARFEQPAPGRWAAGHEFVNFAIAVFGPQRRPDANEGQIHGDGEVVHLRAAQVIRVRVIHVRQGIEIDVEHFLGGEFSHRLQEASVATGESRDDVGGMLARELFLQILGADDLPPKLTGGIEVRRAWSFLAVIVVRIVSGKIKLLALQEVRDIRAALVQPFQIALEDGTLWSDVALAAGHLGQARTEEVELLRIGLKKQNVGWVEGIEVAVEKSRGQFVIELVMRELGLLQQTRSESRNVAVGRIVRAHRDEAGEKKGSQRGHSRRHELF